MPTITGYVDDAAGAPAEGRTVRAYRRDTGALLASGVTGPAAEVVGDASFSSVAALLPMNGTAGSTTFTDVKGNVWTPAGGAQISTAHIFFGGGVGVFDGDARITTPDSAALRMAAGDFTVEFLVRFTATGINHVIVNKGLDSGAYAYQVWVDSAGKFGFRGFGSGGSLDYNIAGGAMSSGVDYFVSARRSGSTFSLHVNNSLIGTASYSGALRYSATDPLSVGAFSNGVAGLQGYLGQVRITAGVVRPTTTPTGAWPTVGASVPELLAGQYSLATEYVGEVQRIVLDDDAGTLHNDLIDRVMLA